MSQVRILLADDHALVRRGIRTLLESEPGWTVCGEASTGLEAVQQAEELKPDIVVLDITMPHLNGVEATPLILKGAPNAKVLILTMHNAHEITQRAVRAGARGYILKSDTERDLVAAVAALIEDKTFYTSAVSEIILETFAANGTPAASEEPMARVTRREREIIQLLVEGKSNKEVANQLGISVRTVESHRATIIRKLHCHSFSELVRYAIRNKLIDA
ncbi:MAG TPA: response regulator transcription factor [Terriglobia bacterium]|nr:response regulator transcription factor [Terriglobia bacterium]